VIKIGLSLGAILVEKVLIRVNGDSCRQLADELLMELVGLLAALLMDGPDSLGLLTTLLAERPDNLGLLVALLMAMLPI
jgi:hypothetical protein